MRLLHDLWNLWLVWSIVSLVYLWIKKGASGMGVQMFELLEGEKHSEIVWQGEVVHFIYDPNKYTAQAEA